jgi:hypothetical protein
MKYFITLLLLSFFTFLSGLPQCPKYDCSDNKNNICASIKSTLNDLSYNQITLSDICEKGQSCQIKYKHLSSLAYANQDSSFTCEANKEQNLKYLYPGEDCSIKNSVCVKMGKKDGQCVNGKCTGQEENEACSTHVDCLAGLYCSDNICRPQKTFGSDCSDSVECVNQYLCHNKKCELIPFSLNVDEPVGDHDTLDFFKCKFHVFDSNRKCAAMLQKEQGDENGFVKCELGQNCNYTISGKDMSVPCSCGFNAQGFGYCGLGHNKCNNIN